MIFTKENPGNLHQMQNYLSELSGISAKKEIYIYLLGDLRRKTASKTKQKYVLRFPASDIEVVINGERMPYMLPYPGTNIPSNDRYDTKYKDTPEKFIVKVYRYWHEFGIEIKQAGIYQNSLGGGWSEKTQLYRVNDNYFANI